MATVKKAIVSPNIPIDMTDVIKTTKESGEDDLLESSHNKENGFCETGESTDHEKVSESLSDAFSSPDVINDLNKTNKLLENCEKSAITNDAEAVDSLKDELKVANGINKKKTSTERQLETNMTSKVTCLLLDKSASPEGTSPSNTSRYGRARKQKTIADFYPTDLALAMKKTMISPAKSPTKQNKSPKILQTSPAKNLLISKSPKKKAGSSILINKSIDNSVETKLVYMPWNQSNNTTQLKTYAKKDLIQRKLTDKEETGDIMRNMFSIKTSTSPEYSKLSEKNPAKKHKNVKSPNTPMKGFTPSPPKKIRKIVTTPVSHRNKITSTPLDSVNIEKSPRSQISIADKTVSTVQTVHLPESSDVDTVSSVMIKKDYAQKTVVKNLDQEVIEIEKKCIWQLGDLAWARVGSYPFWPCLITRDPVSALFVRRKVVGRSAALMDVIHVTFFADSGRRSWVSSNFLMKFSGLDDFNKLKMETPPEMKKKDPKCCNAFNVTASKKIKWLSAVSEAEMLLRRPAELREEFFIAMFLNTEYCTQSVEKPKKQKVAKIQNEAESNFSLSESLFDSLFTTDKSPVKNKIIDAEEVCTSPDNFVKKCNNVDVTDFVSACLDNIVTKTGNKQIQVQSHMDRWLMKAKQPKENKNKLSLSKKKIVIGSDANKSNENVEDSENLNKSADKSAVPLKKCKLSPKTTPVKMYASVDTVNSSEMSENSNEEKLDNNIGQLSLLHKKNIINQLTDASESSLDKYEINKSIDMINMNIPKKVSLDRKTPIEKSLSDKEIKEDGNLSIATSTPNSKRLRSHQSHSIAESLILENSICPPNSDSDESHVESSEHVRLLKKKGNSHYDNPEFQQFLDQNRDDFFDKLPHLPEDEFMSYLYNTWEYRQILKTDKMKDVDEVCLVKGMTDDIEPTQPKKVKRRPKISNEASCSPVTAREKLQRKKSLKTYYSDKDSDDENSELDSSKLDDANQHERKPGSVAKAQKKQIETKPNDNISTAKNMKKLNKSQIDEPKVEDNTNIEDEPILDTYMASLKIIKPNLFKGLLKEKVCEICESPTNLVKCKGPCGGMYHLLCVQKQLEPSSTKDVGNNSIKRKKKHRKNNYIVLTKKKYNSNISKSDNNIDKSPASLNRSFAVISKSGSKVVTSNELDGELEISPSPHCDDNCAENDLCNGHSTPDNSDENISVTSSVHIVTNAIDFESQLSKKMQEMIDNMITDDTSQDVSSASSSAEGCDWNGMQAGECVIEDARKKVHHKDDTVNKKLEPSPDPEMFKCNDCQRYDIPPCFVCKSIASPKTDCTDRQRCTVTHCNKFFHMDCMKSWPQTKYTTSGVSKYTKKGKIEECQETLSCPRHVCHTCVSDDPQGCKTRFSADKLAKCVRCPATYHCFTQCVPAGSKIITASQIICPKHCNTGSNKRVKIPYHVNTSWCFICAKGGSLICCETCPTSFHAECLNISPPEGGFICEECETGRLPLYGEVVWVKHGNYRWWPALVLHPSEVPSNINSLAHEPGQFAVRFFGGYDYYWVSSGRVFPYQEGDTGHANGGKKSLNSAFMTAIDQAQQAFSIIKNLKETCSNEGELKMSLLPPQYIKLKMNRVVGGLKLTPGEGATPRCGCDPQSEKPCAPDSDCLNRMLLTECSAGVCAAGDRCCNQAFEKRIYPHLEPSRTVHRGWGLKTLVDIKKGEFVIEYVGEVIDEAEFQRRMARRQEMRDENYYFLTLDKDRMIDAGPKGNVARFMNHCCEPNCETQKWTVNGDTRVGLFALKDISADSEVTFNYNLTCAGDDKKTCLCGAKRCAGYIGAKLKQEEPQPKKPKKILQKRRKKKKLTVKPSDSVLSPSTSKRGLAPSKDRRKLIQKEEEIDPSSIEADLALINKAVSEAETRDDGERNQLEKEAKSAQNQLSNGDCRLNEEASADSESKITCDEISDSAPQLEDCNTVSYEKGVEYKIDDGNLKAIKRKRVGEPLENSPKYSPVDKIKRPRSNSVYFSKSVTYIGDKNSLSEVTVVVDKSFTDNYKVSEENGIVTSKPIDNGIDFKDSEKVDSSDVSLSTKKLRGRPRKSV